MSDKLTKTPSAIDLLLPARLTREQVDQFNPMVLYAPRRGQAKMAVLDGDGRLHEMLAEVLAQMRPQLGPPVWIAVTTDAYVKPTPTPDLEAGQLAKQFAEGDMSVSEQLVVILRHRSRPTEVAVQSYRNIPSEGWEWDEPERIEKHEGPVMAVLDHYII